MVIPFQELTIINQLQILLSHQQQHQHDRDHHDELVMMNTIWRYPVRIQDYLSQFYIKHIGENIIRHTPYPTLGDTIMISIANEGISASRYSYSYSYSYYFYFYFYFWLTC